MMSVSGMARMKLPPSEMNAFALPSRTASQVPTVSRPRSRGVKAVLLSEAIERDELGFFRDPDRALALDIRMASHRKDAGPGLADVAAHEQQIAQHPNCLLYTSPSPTRLLS